MSKITRDLKVNAEYGMIRGFGKLAAISPNETLGYAGWRRLNRPRRCLSRFAKRVKKVLWKMVQKPNSPLREER